MKSFFTYLFLVGIPAAGLLGILHVGRGLDAPRAIGGEWRIAAGPLAGSRFVVQQSGEHLSLVLPVKGGVQLRGMSRGDTLELAHAGSALTHTEACDPVRGTTLRAVLDFSAGARMRGTARVGGSAACPPIPFEAARAAVKAPKGASH
ncbi:MAG: hypothetical protein ICV87_12810 [Gemmatimonadetes bacterium]|nr:hypothetical protein [Gemmatimonadota bacterium]